VAEVIIKINGQMFYSRDVFLSSEYLRKYPQKVLTPINNVGLEN
jgi:hypothetical protein